MSPRLSSSSSSLSHQFRLVCEARAEWEQTRARSKGAAAEGTLAVHAAAARYHEATRRYNEALLRCPE